MKLCEVTRFEPQTNVPTIWQLKKFPIHRNPEQNTILIQACERFIDSPQTSIPNKLEALRLLDRANGVFQETYSFSDLKKHQEGRQTKAKANRYKELERPTFSTFHATA